MDDDEFVYSDDNDDDIYLIIMIMLVAAKQIMMSLYNDDIIYWFLFRRVHLLENRDKWWVALLKIKKHYNDCDCEDRSQEKYFNYGDCEMIVMIIR